MEFKTYDEKSYKIHTIKTNRFKTSKIEIFFRKEITEKEISVYAFLAELINEGNKNYPSRKEKAIRSEELYRPFFRCYPSKIGKSLNLIFTLDFINPCFIEEKDYLKEVIAFYFEMFLNPNVKAGEFDNDTFKMVQKNIIIDIESIEENPEKTAINKALTKMDKNSVAAINLLGTKKEAQNMTSSKVYEAYRQMLNTFAVDVFVIGDTDMDAIAKEIKKNFTIHQIRDSKIDYYVNSPIVRKSQSSVEPSKFVQSQLIMLYTMKDLTTLEKELTFHVCNYILGSGGLSSKLYKYIREENSYCYRVSSMYFKYDNLLCIASSLSKENAKHAITLTKKAIKEMQSGNFTDEDVSEAKKNLLISLKMNRNNPGSILSNYVFKTFVGSYDIEQKIEKLDSITKEDVVKVAKKLKENTIFVLEEAEK